MPALPPVELDLRSLMDDGNDLRSAIVEARSNLRDGQPLTLLLALDPTRLYDCLASESAQIHPRTRGSGTWQVTLTRSAGDVVELDLQDLAPPGPLHHAMEAIAHLPRGKSLKIHTRFRPVFLLEELQNGDGVVKCEEMGAQHWLTQITPQSQS